VTDIVRLTPSMVDALAHAALLTFEAQAPTVQEMGLQRTTDSLCDPSGMKEQPVDQQSCRYYLASCGSACDWHHASDTCVSWLTPSPMLLQTSRTWQRSLQRKRLQLSQCMAVAFAPKPTSWSTAQLVSCTSWPQHVAPAAFEFHPCWCPRGPREKPIKFQAQTVLAGSKQADIALQSDCVSLWARAAARRQLSSL